MIQEHPIQESFFQGAVSIEHGDGWMKPWRLPFNKISLFYELLVGRAACAAGVRLRIRTNAESIGLRYLPEGEGIAKFDCVVDNQLVESVSRTPDSEDVWFSRLPAGEKTVEIWLPVNRPVAVCGILTNAGASAVAAADTRFRWVVYGSSITQCVAAHSPARTWPGTVARARNWHLTCMGFGGNCNMEPLVARTISTLPADFITLKLGINVCGGGTLSIRTFRSAVIGMVSLIRERHPETPILLISPIISPPRETALNPVGMSLSIMRSEIAEAHRLLVADGDQHLSYACGLDVFGPELLGPRLPDDLHPDGDGYEQLGRNVIEKILPQVLEVNK